MVQLALTGGRRVVARVWLVVSVVINLLLGGETDSHDDGTCTAALSGLCRDRLLRATPPQLCTNAFLSVCAPV